MSPQAAWLERMLQAELGPGAALGTLRFDGPLLHLEGARLPLGEGARLDVARAVLELGRGPAIGELPIAARLVSLAGTLHAPGLVLPVDFVESAEGDAGGEAYVRGTLRAAALDLELGLHVGPGGVHIEGRRLAGETLSGEISLRSGEEQVLDLALATGSGARFTGWIRRRGEVPGSDALPQLLLRIDRAGARLLSRLAVFAGIALPPGIPPDLAVTGELTVHPGGAASGRFAIETARTELVLRLSASGTGDLFGSTLRGRFGAADAARIGLFPDGIRPGPLDAIHLDARLGGTIARPVLAGRADAVRGSFEIAGAEVVVEGASVLFEASGERVSWQVLEGRIWEGRFTGTGWAAVGSGGDALGGRVAWRGVRVEVVAAQILLSALPPGVSGHAFFGASSGEIAFERGSLPGQDLQARGRVEVAEPVYLFVRSLRPLLARYGLPPLRPRSREPLVAEVRLEHGELVVEPLSAAVDGIDVDGAVRLHLDGRLLGRLRVRLRESYLAASPLLALPAAFAGELVLPMDLGGTLSAPFVQTDAVEILDGLLARGGVGDVAKGMLDGLWRAARARRGKR